MPRTEISLMIDEHLLEHMDQELVRIEYEDTIEVSRSELINQILAIAYQLEYGPEPDPELLNELTDLKVNEEINQTGGTVVVHPSSASVDPNPSSRNYTVEPAPDDNQSEKDPREQFDLIERGVSPEIFENTTETRRANWIRNESSDIKRMIAEDLAKAKQNLDPDEH